MRMLVIGTGQVGTAILTVLQKKYPDVMGVNEGVDIFGVPQGKFDVIHICFGYSETFIEDVRLYASKYLMDGGLVIIHSTIPEGTTEKIPNAVHSPIRGIHPNLVNGIMTFPKAFGGKRAEEAAKIFQECGVATKCVKNPRNTEFFKVADTTYYGWNIIFQKAIYSYCQEKGLDFDFVYTWGNRTYNEGYEKLEMPHVQRPVLKHIPGKIGGHCVINNLKLWKHDISNFIKSQNDLL